MITRIAGIGVAGHAGDGGLATAAELAAPTCAQQQPDGSVLIAENGDVRRVAPNGVISTVQVTAPDCARASLPDGSLLAPSSSGYAVNLIAPTGVSKVVAGNEMCGASGDGGPAIGAMLAGVTSVAAIPGGGFLIADGDNHVIRRVSPDGTITTVAGVNTLKPDCGASGSYGPPIYLLLSTPLRARANTRVKVSYETTFPVHAQLTISRGKRTFGRARVTGITGLNTITLRARLRSGRYTITLQGSGTTSGGEVGPMPFTKTDVESLVVSR